MTSIDLIYASGKPHINNMELIVMDEHVIAGCLSHEEIIGLKQMFKGMYTHNSGTITVEELKHGLSKQGTRLLESEVKYLEAITTIEQVELNNGDKGVDQLADYNN
ncbi:calcium-dependent protein kinase 2-like protein [Tanacetum coccineum]